MPALSTWRSIRHMDAQTAFSKFVDEVGGRAEAAKRLDITVGMVGHVVNGVRSLSVERAKLVEVQTEGRISRADLRPDVFGPADQTNAA